MLQVIYFGVRVTKRTAPNHEVMVAADRMKPRTGQPVQHLAGFWSSVYQVSYREQAILGWIEIDVIQGLLQRCEAAVDVAYGEIAPLGVNTETYELRGRGAGVHRPMLPVRLSQSPLFWGYGGGIPHVSFLSRDVPSA